MCALWQACKEDGLFWKSILMVMMASGSKQFISHAASKKTTSKKALAAYERLLSKSTYKWSVESSENNTKDLRFCVVDANKDGIKDLLLINSVASHASGYYKLLTYNKGKVRCVLTGDSIEVYKKAGIVSFSFSGTGTFIGHYYKIKNGKAVERAAFKATDTKEYAKPKVKHKDGKGAYAMYYYSYTIKGKEVSYKTYKKKIKKLLKKEKASDLVYYDNTAENRTAYIK